MTARLALSLGGSAQVWHVMQIKCIVTRATEIMAYPTVDIFFTSRTVGGLIFFDQERNQYLYITAKNRYDIPRRCWGIVFAAWMLWP